MAKFKVGEVAVFVGAGSTETTIARYLGSEVTITDPLASRPFECWHTITPHTPRYGIRFPDGHEAWVREEALRKRRPPEQPADDQEFIDWFNKTIRKEPLEKTMTKVAENMGRFTTDTGAGHG